MSVSNVTLKKDVFRVKIIENFDPERPSWAKSDSVFLADHPSTYAGYLTKHFYGNSINVGDEIPSWTYDTISNHGFDSASWNTQATPTSNVMPPNSGPFPNTQGVYSGQESLLGKELSKYKISDIDVLRFWPAGRPNAYGGLPPYQIYDSSTESLNSVGGATIIDKGASDNSNLSPYTYFYYDSWLNDCKYLPLTVPSYMHNSGEANLDYELYPKIPKVGMWTSGGKDLGITKWTWQSYSTTKKYGRFCSSWHQNLSASLKRNTTELNNHPYGDDEEPSKELTYQKDCGTDGSPGVAPATNAQGLTIVANSGDTTDAGVANMFLLDTLWNTTYYTGGFLIENKGLAYHLRNAVKWNNLGDAPSIGDIKDGQLTSTEGVEGNIYDGNVGAIPPLMTFAGGGGAWSDSLKNIAPYNKYLDWDEEAENLNQYYSNESTTLLCEIMDGKGRLKQIYIKKPNHLLISDNTTQRVCPEYKEGEILLVTNNERGEFIDLNIGAKKLIDYSTKGTLEPYFDYFPDNYIPFESNFLLPPDQKIPSYSFNCFNYTYSSEIKTNTEGEKGGKGEKGSQFGGVTTVGERGDWFNGSSYSAGNATDGGTKGEKGPNGGKGERGDWFDGSLYGAGSATDGGIKGEKGLKGQKGIGSNGAKGTGIITGGFGTVSSDSSNYTLSNYNGTIAQVLGDAALHNDNNKTTVTFSRKFFGVANEHSHTSPGCTYSGMHMWASNYID